MFAVDFPERNKILLKPDGVSDAECSSLYAYDTGEAFVSCWKLTPEEVLEIARTGTVWLWVLGQRHPPVTLEVANPFQPKVT